MPNSVTMRRASSVARWMSSLAPVLMVPNTIDLGGASAEHHREAILELLDGQQVAVLGGHLQRVAERARGCAARC